jgi:tRNA 2-selenouridine synthase SelU
MQLGAWPFSPSKGKMYYMYNDASPKRESEKKIKKHALQAILNLQDRDVDHAIASRFVPVADDLADKENKKISCSLPNGGQSKAAVNKRKKLAGQVFNGMAKQIGGSNANDFREEAIDASLKQAPFLMCGDCSPSKSSSEQAAPTSAVAELG